MWDLGGLASFLIGLQIASAIKERKEAEKTHARLIRMKVDEENFKKALKARRKIALQVSYHVMETGLYGIHLLHISVQLLFNLIDAG